MTNLSDSPVGAQAHRQMRPPTRRSSHSRRRRAQLLILLMLGTLALAGVAVWLVVLVGAPGAARVFPPPTPTATPTATPHVALFLPDATEWSQADNQGGRQGGS